MLSWLLKGEIGLNDTGLLSPKVSESDNGVALSNDASLLAYAGLSSLQYSLLPFEQLLLELPLSEPLRLNDQSLDFWSGAFL